MEIDIENIAGIRAGKAAIHPGLNIVRAENWQGKSSFITAIQVGMGTTGGEDKQHPLRDGASKGRVRLSDGKETYNTELVRNGRTVQRRGDSYLADEQDRVCAQLFAFLDENNAVRAAVRNGGDLAALLTRPLDMGHIDEQIADRKQERRSAESRIESAREATEKIVSVKSRITQLEGEVEALEAKRADLQSTVDHESANQDQQRLSDKRAEKERLRNQVTTVENKIARQNEQFSQCRSALEELAVPEEPGFTDGIDRKKEKIRELETDTNLLEDLYRTNKRVLDEGKAGLVSEIEHTMTGDSLDCWLCGHESTESTVAERLAAIEQKAQQLRTDREELESEIETIRQKRDEIQNKRRQKRDFESEISELELKLEENKSRLKDRKQRLEEVATEVETLRESVVDTTDELTDIESEIKYKRNELDEQEDKQKELEVEAGKLEQLEQTREQLTEEIESLRARRNRKKRELAERFEETMSEIIERFEPGFESARLSPKVDSEGEIVDYELVLARDGRETSIDALSEGEVELLGIVTALAGYETFDVDDRAPFILLDGLTALSTENYYSLVEYLRERADCLVTTAYPEVDEFDGHTLTPYDWDVVSHHQPSVS